MQSMPPGGPQGANWSRNYPTMPSPHTTALHPPPQRAHWSMMSNPEPVGSRPAVARGLLAADLPGAQSPLEAQLQAEQKYIDMLDSSLPNNASADQLYVEMLHAKRKVRDTFALAPVHGPEATVTPLPSKDLAAVKEFSAAAQDLSAELKNQEDSRSPSWSSPSAAERAALEATKEQEITHVRPPQHRPPVAVLVEHQQEKSALHAKLAEMQQRLTEMATVNGNMAKMKDDEIFKLKKELAITVQENEYQIKAKDDKISELWSKLGDGSADGLKEQLALQSENSAKLVRVKDAEIEQLKSQLGRMEMRLMGGDKDSSADQELAELRNKLSIKQEEYTVVVEKFEALQTDVGKRWNKFKDREDQKNEQLVEMSKKLEAFESSSRSRSSEAGEAGKLKKEVSRLETELDKSSSEVSKLQRQLSSIETRTERELASKDSELADLKKQLASASRSSPRSSGEVTELRSQLSAIKIETSQLTQTIERERNSSASARAEFQQEIKKKDSEIALLKQRLEDAAASAFKPAKEVRSRASTVEEVKPPSPKSPKSPKTPKAVEEAPKRKIPTREGTFDMDAALARMDSTSKPKPAAEKPKPKPRVDRKGFDMDKAMERSSSSSSKTVTKTVSSSSSTRSVGNETAEEKKWREREEKAKKKALEREREREAGR